MNRTILTRTLKAAPLRAAVIARPLSVLVRAPAPQRLVRPRAVQSVVVGARFKTTKSWGPPTVTYEELKPLTEQPNDVRRVMSCAGALKLINLLSGHPYRRFVTRVSHPTKANPTIPDVRENDEVALGSIPSAVSLPLSVLKDHLSPTYNAGTFQSEHAFSKPLPEQKIIFFCRSGKRSATACQLASEAGYKNLRNYEGSWLDWTKKEAESGAGGYKGEDDD